MDMDGKAIELIQKSAQAEYHEVEREGVLFTNRKMEPVIHDPRPDALQVHSLTAIVDYIKSELDSLKDEEGGDVVLHVESPTLVSLVSSARPPRMARTKWLQANAPENPFKYSQCYDAESFNIALQSMFVDAGSRAEILRIVGTVTSLSEQKDLDDGVQQKVETKRGLVLGTGDEKLPNPVTLVPWRTFREVEQPASIFVLRASEGPSFALFEADGSAWRLEAMQSIKAWLETRLSEVAIIA